MIASIRGKVVHKGADSVVVEVGGLGYEVYLVAADWGASALSREVQYHVYHHIREDIQTLYGFKDPEAKQMFVQLLSISGIGPKVALAVLSSANLDRLKQAIVSGDPELLKGISGVGKKTAERIVLELKNKIEATGIGVASSKDSTYQALIGLGYNANQAAKAAASVPTDITDEQERIKRALMEVARD